MSILTNVVLSLHDLFSPAKFSLSSIRSHQRSSPHLKMSYLSLMLLLLLLLVATAQGIRSGPMSVSLSNHQGLHEGTERNSIKGNSVGEVVIGTNGQDSGSNRKLVANEMPTPSKIAKSGVEVEATKNNPSSRKIDHDREGFSVKSSSSERQQTNERYPDVVDIAGMDYSPAKRKPPIHN